MIKAIDTAYRGYLFRSRLEARWAVFFDQIGLRYEYEVEGLSLPSGNYLPDFYLREFDTYLEIKPIPDGHDREKRFGREIVGPKHEETHESEVSWANFTHTGPGFMLFGGPPLEVMNSWHKKDGLLYWHPTHLCSNNFSKFVRLMNDWVRWDYILETYPCSHAAMYARKARFEHGASA